MMQKNVWEKEYRNPRLVSGSHEPQTSVKDFLRWLRREQKLPLENIRAVDFGCGNGKNSLYIAELDFGNEVVGIDISETALAQARFRAHELAEQEKIGAAQTSFENRSIGEPLPYAEVSFDVALDVTSSNSLSEKERAIYVGEVHRILKIGGYFFVRALCKDGDKNAAALLDSNPGRERDTYILPEMGLAERVFTREDFIATYANGGVKVEQNADVAGTAHGRAHFEILRLEKETHYTKFAGRSYKRNFWVAYLRKT